MYSILIFNYFVFFGAIQFDLRFDFLLLLQQGLSAMLLVFKLYVSLATSNCS